VNPRMALVGAATLVVTLGAVLVLTRPGREAPATAEPTALERLPGELPPLQDEAQHYAPGSPAAVSEGFLRAWWRGRYEAAGRLATGEMRRRCDENHTKTLNLTPDLREQMRQVQVIAEAAAFDLERAVTEDVRGDGGAPRKIVRGEIHAHGASPDGHRVENRRAQELELELVDGAWRVARWTPGRSDGGITVGRGP